VSSPNGPASSGASEPALIVIGCGNPVRGDDGVALEVIRRLRAARPALPEGVELIDAGTAGMDVMFRVRHAREVVIVDACRSGSEPGAIFRLPGREAMTPVEPAFTLHGLRWDHALYAGTRMFGGDFVDRTEVLLIEAATLDFGLELSAPVRLAAQRAAEMIAARIDAEAELVASVADGRLHLPARTHARALAGCAAVALLADAGRWWLLPLRSGAGGLQLKQRNASGDRVVEAREFLRAQGLDDGAALALTLRFVAERGGYELVPAAATANSSNAAVALAAYISDGPPPM
jgi:hydrogenase maturation protease